MTPLKAVYNGRQAEEIFSTSPEFPKTIGLYEHLRQLAKIFPYPSEPSHGKTRKILFFPCLP